MTSLEVRSNPIGFLSSYDEFRKLFTEEPPFSHLQEAEFIIEVATNGLRPPRPGENTLQRGLSDDVWEIMQNCWRRSAHERLKAKDLHVGLFQISKEYACRLEHQRPKSVSSCLSPIPPPKRYDYYFSSHRDFHLSPTNTYAHNHQSSSDPIEGLDDIELYPLIRDWLVVVDNSPRGEDGQNFQQHGAGLCNIGFQKIHQLVDERFTADLLSRHRSLSGLTKVDATSLLNYAKEDVANIRLKETKRIKQNRAQPTRYTPSTSFA